MRRTIFWLHLGTGVVAGVIIMIMSVTGVLLMYQRQITNWADGVVVPAPAPNSTRLPVESLLGKLREVQSAVPASITVNRDSRAAASFTFGREHIVHVDPYTGAILGEGSKSVRVFFRFMIDWHRWLGM